MFALSGGSHCFVGYAGGGVGSASAQADSEADGHGDGGQGAEAGENRLGLSQIARVS